MLEVQQSSQSVSPTPFYRRRAFLVPFCIIVLSLIPKLIIMPLIFHYDLISVAWSSRTLAIGNWDIYDTGLRSWVQNANWSRVDSPVSHGPLFFYPYGAWLWLNGLLGTFPVQHWTTPYGGVLTALNLFVLKLPALLADLASAFFISRIFAGATRNRALGLWLFAPMTFYFTFATGQDDIFMIVCICASLYFAANALKKAQQQYEAGLPQPFLQREALLAVALLGVGTCVKLFSLFFIPILVIILSKRAGRTLWQDYRRVGLLLGFSILPIVVVFAPLTLLSKVFLNSVLISSETNLLSNLIFYDGLGTIAWFWLLYFMLIVYLIYDASQYSARQYTFNSLATCVIYITFLFLIISNYQANFVTWSLPAFVIMVAQRPRLILNYLIHTFCQVITTLIIYTYNFDLNALWVSREQLPASTTGSTSEFISKFIPTTQVMSIIGPIALLNLVVMFVWYRRSITEPLFEHWSIFRKHTNITNTTNITNIEEPLSVQPPRRLPLAFLLGAPLILFVGLAGTLYFLSVSSSGLRLVAQESVGASPVAILLPGTVVRQDFVASAGQLARLDLMFNTSDRLNVSTVDFALYQDGVTAPIMTSHIDAFYVRAHVYYPVKLPQTLKIAQATHFYFTLSSSDATARSSLAVASQDTSNIAKPVLDIIPAAQINGVPTNQVLQFRVVDAIDWGARWHIVLDYLGRTPLFSALYYGFCLLLAILLIVGLYLNRLAVKANQPDNN